jgi:cytochrome c biogenesis protein CcmG/thiol:disulfide interchange protein DsbE
VNDTARRRWRPIVTLLVLLAMSAWAAIRMVPPPEGVRIGDRAPDYRVVPLAGGDSVGLRSTVAGHVTLVNIWATWCGPCRQEMPSIERLYQLHRAQGFRVAGVSIDEGPADSVRAFVAKYQLSFDIFLDRSMAIQAAYQTIGVPGSYLLDRHGRVAYTSLGGEDWTTADNQRRITALLASGR